MSWVPSCHCCPTALAADAAPNFVTVDGDLLTICGDCWDDADGFVCDVCDRLAETTYDGDDVADGCAPLAFWPWDGWTQVCPACVWPLDPAEWVTRHGLPADAAEVAAALAGEWADDLDALADAARLLAGGVPA